MSNRTASPFSTKMLCLMAVFAALIAICSWISIPIMSIPVTLQLLAVLLCASLLSPLQSATAVVVYVLLGLVGLPVFSGFTGGVGRLFGITGGYIIGFIPAAWVTSLIISKWGRSIPKQLAAMVAGVAVCYLFGTLWFMNINQQNVASFNASLANMTEAEIAEAGGVKTAYSLGQVLGICVIPYLPFDAVKIVLAAILGSRLYAPLNTVLRR